MGTPTGRTVRRIQGTGRGSEYYGGCDCCGKSMSEAFKLLRGQEYRRKDGELYDNAFAVSYGHRDCLMREFGALLQAG